jgi:hypothetical protein
MQLAIKEFIRLGGYDAEGEIKKDTVGNYIIKPDPIAKLFNVDRRSLRRRLEKKLIKENKGRPSYLSEDGESYLLDLLTIRALIARPLDANELKFHAKQQAILYLEQKIASPDITQFQKQVLSNKLKTLVAPKDRWYHNFMTKYNSEIGSRLAKLMSKNKTKAMSREKLNDFYELVEYAISKTNLTFENNYDLLSKIIYN